MQAFQPSWRGAPLGLEIYWSGNVWGPQCECHALRKGLVEAFAKPTRNELIIGSDVDAATTNQTFFWMSDRCGHNDSDTQCVASFVIRSIDQLVSRLKLAAGLQAFTIKFIDAG